MEKDFGDRSNSCLPKDLGKSRLSFNNKSVKNAVEVMSNWGSPFQSRETLVNICSGVEASQEVQDDILKAEHLGEMALQKFLEERINSSEVSFYSPIKRFALKTFQNMKVKKVIQLKEKTVTLAAERSMFGRLLVIAKSREGLSLKDVLQYSLSPISWSLGLPDGTIVKTVKSKLLSKINAFH